MHDPDELSKRSGIEIPFWESEWQEVYFSELGVELSEDNLATDVFYTSFYAAVARKYGTYWELPQSWRDLKTETAQELSCLIAPNSTVGSFGCGIGFVEWVLARDRPDVRISCHDFAPGVECWPVVDVENVEIGWTPTLNEADGGGKFDLVYVCQVLHALPYEAAVDLLKELAQRIGRNGRLILVHFSANPSENHGFPHPEENAAVSKIQRLMHSPVSVIKGRLRMWCKALKVPSRNQQFWGWHRDNKRYQTMAEEAGLETVDVFPAVGQSFLVLGRNCGS